MPFLYIKGLDIKTSLISAEGYKNAGFFMKDVGVGLGVKSISGLVLKEIHGICGKK